MSFDAGGGRSLRTPLPDHLEPSQTSWLILREREAREIHLVHHFPSNFKFPRIVASSETLLFFLPPSLLVDLTSFFFHLPFSPNSKHSPLYFRMLTTQLTLFLTSFFLTSEPYSSSHPHPPKWTSTPLPSFSPPLLFLLPLLNHHRSFNDSARRSEHEKLVSLPSRPIRTGRVGTF